MKLCRRCNHENLEEGNYCSDCKEYERLRSQRRRKDNPELLRKMAREAQVRYRERYPERTREACSKWCKTHPENNRARVHRRRARLLDQFIEDVDHKIVWERDQGICGICNEAADETKWHLDHILALSLGGLHSYENVQVSHPLCNIRKGHKERWTGR